MRKEIKQWGNSAGITLTKEDLKVYDAEIGDVIDISDIVIIKKKEGKKK